MNISPIQSLNKTNTSRCIPKADNKQKVSFKGVYVEDIVDLGKASQGALPAKFLQSDALLLNKIAQEYPNQDCFIRKGYAGHPYLEFREKPPEVQIFSSNLLNIYTASVNPNDKVYPCEPLLLYKDSRLNRFIGMTSFISTNPSLPYTIKVGFELHKKLLEKKKQIQEAIGKNDDINIGSDMIKRAHSEIKETETAITRYLMECSNAALTDRATAQQIYSSNYPKIQTRLDAERTLDLTTSMAKRPKINPQDFADNKVDICEEVNKLYPHYKENKNRIFELENYMAKNGIVLG